MRCAWHRYIPEDESPRGFDAGLLEYDRQTGWRCKHHSAGDTDYCLHHEMQAVRFNMILDWATYQLSRRREGFVPYAYDWVCRPEVARSPLDTLAAALDFIIQERARDGAKRGNIEVADLVRALHSVKRDQRRDSRGASCHDCLGTGWFTVYSTSKPGITGVVPCHCHTGGQRRSSLEMHGSKPGAIRNLPLGWSLDPP